MITINYFENEGTPLKKVIDYGNITAKIIMADIKMINKRYTIDLVLESEGPSNFEGFKTKNGYITKGPVTFATLTRYFITQETMNAAAKRLLHIATLQGNREAFLKEGNKFETFIQYFTKIKKYIIGDKYLHFCIGAIVKNIEGRPYPYYSSYIVRDESPLLAISDTKDNIVIFDKSKHLIYRNNDTQTQNSLSMLGNTQNYMPNMQTEQKGGIPDIPTDMPNDEVSYDINSDDIPF